MKCTNNSLNHKKSKIKSDGERKIPLIQSFSLILTSQRRDSVSNPTVILIRVWR